MYGLAVDEPVEVPVVEFDGGLVGSVGGKAHLDLARVFGVGVVLPLAVDLPGDDQAARWLLGEHAAPVAFAVIDGSATAGAARAQDSGTGRRPRRVLAVKPAHRCLAVVRPSCRRTLTRHELGNPAPRW